MLPQKNFDQSQNHKEGPVFHRTQILMHKAWSLVYDLVFCSDDREE